MATAQVWPARFWKDSGWTALARVQLPSGANATQASLTSINCTVKNQAGTTTYGPTALTIASVIFDTLQTSDSRWTEDSTGFNFAHEVPASAFSASGHYRVEYHFDPASGENFTVAWEGPALSRF